MWVLVGVVDTGRLGYFFEVAKRLGLGLSRLVVVFRAVLSGGFAGVRKFAVLFG